MVCGERGEMGELYVIGEGEGVVGKLYFECLADGVACALGGIID